MKSAAFASSFRGDLGLLTWFAFLAIAAYLLFIPPETVTAIAIPPDSSEYAVGLVNLLEHGQFGFTLNGTWYPSRYAPWFSLFCLTPAYFLGGGNALCLNWAVLVFSVTMLALVGAWGRKSGLNSWWSIGAAALLLLLPDFVFYSRVVMTEIPYATLFAASALVFLRLVDRRREVSVRSCLGAGVLIAWGGAVRPTLLPMLLPFAVVIAFCSGGMWRWRLVRLLVLSLPSVGYELASMGYNRLLFGSVARSGYQYWMPIPCDYPELLFRFEYVLSNVRGLLTAPVIQVTLVVFGVNAVYAAGVLGGRFGGVRSNRGHLLLTAYLSFQALVLLVLYLGYYWTDTRFFLPITLCSVPLFLTAVRRILNGIPRLPRFLVFGSVLALCSLAFLSSPTRYYHMLPRRQFWLEVAKISAQVLPEGAVVIHDGDPCVLDHFCFRAKGIRIVPFLRRFDYVFNMIAPKSIRDVGSAPATWKVRILPSRLEDGSCFLPFPRTFSEDPALVCEMLDAGKRVFLEQTVLREEAGWEPFQRTLRELGLASRHFGTWSSPATEPDPIRHVYDTLLFGDDAADSRMETFAVYHEIVRTGEVVK